jgi:diguanylate cyclase (GGDEF)-like protein/PAS domain S-box-containing protein
VLGVIRVGDMVETARVAGSAARSMGLIILDLDAAPSERLLYPKNASFGLPAGFRSTRTISVAGRNWLVTAYPLPGAFTVAHWNSWTALVTGLLLTGLWTGYRHDLDRHLLAVKEDITKLKRAEEELQLTQFSVEHASDAIFWVDSQGHFVYVNQAACRSLGRSREELLCLSIWDINPQLTEEAWRASWAGIRTRGSIVFESQHETKQGGVFPVEVTANYREFDGKEYGFAFVRDISEHKRAERYQHLSAEILGALNEPLGVTDVVNHILTAIKRETGLDAIAIRLRSGDDFPYFVQSGFSPEFLSTENTLIARDKNGGPCRDKNGNISLECTCGLVISGQTDPANPLFTQGGSCWTNNSLPLLDLPAHQDPRLHPRNKCTHQGYCSVALIPIRANRDIVGLMQLNDRKKNCFTLGMIHFFEGLSASIGVALMRKQQEDALRTSEKRYRLLFERNLAGVVRTTLDGRILEVNQAAAGMFGFDSPEEALAISVTGLYHTASDREAFLTRLKSEKSLTNYEGKFRRKDGEPVWVLENVSLVDDRIIESTLIDITERKRTEEELYRSRQMLQTILDTIPQRVFWKDRNCIYLGCNRILAIDAGLNNPAEIIGKSDFDLAWRETAEVYRADDKLVMEQGSAKLGFEETQDRPDGGRVWLRTSKLPLWDREGKVIGVLGTYEDITERKVAEERVQFLAYYDALTGLPNRILLRDRLSQALATARRQKHKVALLFLDLDRFKIINDSLGHSVGDLLLQNVAERLKRCAREQDTVARLGGDEFLIVLTNVKDIPGAAVAAERFMDAMTAEFVVQGHSLSIGCSLGISIFPENGADSETLIKNADAAMYSAKDGGRNNFQFFTADMSAQAVERLTLENGLRLALDKKELFLVYQPQMDITTGKITGLEALLRWQHPELGLVPPDKFIRITENSGLIMPIGEWVLRTACSQARKWQDEGLTAVSVAVNVSAVQFRQDFPETVRRVLHETGLAPQYLELELTESLLLSNADVVFSVLHQLTAMGLRLAIDDFGTGYSSLSYLKQFPVSKLKIDRSFIRDLAVNPDEAAITTAIISMAKSLNLKVIAEGVENEAQMAFLRAHQCDEIQGYYFSKPLAADEVADKLRADYSEAHVRAQASGRQP